VTSPAGLGPTPAGATAWMATSLGKATDALEIVTVEVDPPAANQVRVNVESFSLDYNDIDTIYGRYGLLKLEAPFVPGMVAAGIVDAAGPGAEALLGRRVIGVTVGVQGGYATVALLDAPTVQTVPNWLSFVDATAMYFPYLLGWLALRTRGRLQEGETVLIHAGAGGVGSGVIQLAKAFGAVVIATAGSDEAFVDDVTNGRGVDLAFDTVGGQVTTDTYRTMAFNGRHLIVGYAADIALEEQPVSMQPSIYGNFDLVGICFAFVDDPRLTHSLGMNFLTRADGIAIWARILQMAQAKEIRPVVGSEIDFDHVPHQLERMEHRETMGKSVVRAAAVRP
jgi:NADPH2:quinone reductase